MNRAAMGRGNVSKQADRTYLRYISVTEGTGWGRLEGGRRGDGEEN